MSTVRKQSDADQQEPAKSVPIRAGEKRGIGRWWSDARTFLSEVRTEMRRVTWPSRREVYATTLVVILTAMFFGLYLWGLDLAIDRMVRWIFRVSGVA
jgi:preprotein translocase subunit SecE